jgi:PAS domain S-box-containing protein
MRWWRIHLKKFLSFLGIVVLSFSAIVYAFSALTVQAAPQAIRGVIDLRQWDFAHNGVVTLTGAWEFYWYQLLTPETFSAAAPPAPPGLIPVPSSWRGSSAAGQSLSGDGYATYRLTVLINPTARAEPFLALNIPASISTAHRLYVDGQLVGSAGQVGPTIELMMPQYTPYLVVFAPTSDKVEILLQVANFYHYEGGIIAEPLVLGTQSQIQHLNEQHVGREFFLIGSIFMIGLYHLLLFVLRRRDRSPLYLGLFCMLVAGVTLFLAQPLVFATYLSQRWDVFMRTLIFMGTLAIFTQALFVQTLFVQDASTWALRVLFGVMALLASLALIVSARTITTLVPLLTLQLTLVSLYTLGIVLKAVVHKREGAGIFLVGYIPLLIAAINDVLVFNQRTPNAPLVSVGLFLFILAQAYLLSVRSANAFMQTEMLSGELRQSEEQYRTLFEDSKDLIFITALDGRVEAVNPACFDVLGYTRDESMNLNVLVFYANPAERLRFQEAVAQTGAVTDFPVTLRCKNGHELECQMTATLRRDKTGQPIGYEGIVHDVTAYKQAEAQRQRVLALQDLNEKLEQRVEARAVALTEAHASLHAEIEQRQSHQQEKDRLLALAHQQSDHLRTMSKWLIAMQQAHYHNQAVKLDADIQQKMTDIRQNLGMLQGMAGVEQNPGFVTYVFDTIRLLTEVEIYVEQVSATLNESSPAKDVLAGNPLLLLSSRERQVLTLMAEGKSNPEIANILTIRLNTVHTYLKRIRSKLDIQDTPGLIHFARDNGLLR